MCSVDSVLSFVDGAVPPKDADPALLTKLKAISESISAYQDWLRRISESFTSNEELKLKQRLLDQVLFKVIMQLVKTHLALL
jgi:hypothetical protein